MANSSHIALVPIDGDLDVTTVPTVRHTLDSLIDSGCRRIVLNLAATTYVDSAGMGLIVGVVRRMRQRGGLVSLINVSASVARALSIARIVDFVPISELGSHPQVPELAVGTLPIWRTVLRIDPHNLSKTRAHVAHLIDRMPFTADEAFDLGLAVGEAIGNAVDHAGGFALVEISCFRDRAVIEVSDCGQGFDTRQCAKAVEPDAERGRGISLMRLLADSVEIAPKPSGAGTCVRIVKLLPR